MVLNVISFALVVQARSRGVRITFVEARDAIKEEGRTEEKFDILKREAEWRSR